VTLGENRSAFVDGIKRFSVLEQVVRQRVGWDRQIGALRPPSHNAQICGGWKSLQVMKQL